MFGFPCITRQPVLQKLGGIVLHKDLGFEVDPSIQSQILVIGPGIAIRTTVFAAAIGIHALTEVHVRTVIFADDALGIVVQKLCRDATQLFEELGIVFEVGVIWYGMNAAEAIRRIDGGTAAMRSWQPHRPFVDVAHNGSFQTNPVNRLNDSPRQRFTAEPRIQILDGHLFHATTSSVGGTSQVRRDDNIVQLQQRVIAWQWFG
jgi:hypothetical protein